MHQQPLCSGKFRTYTWIGCPDLGNVIEKLPVAVNAVDGIVVIFEQKRKLSFIMEIGHRSNYFSSLRNRAEEFLNKSLTSEPHAADNELTQLMHELDLYESELSIQRNEIMAANALIEAERTKLATFYNAAPIGYMVLDHVGIIQQISPKGAALLQDTAETPIGYHFERCVHPAYRDAYREFLNVHTLNADGGQCELMLNTSLGKAVKFIILHGNRSTDVNTGRHTYYITVSDITASKLEAQRAIELTERLDLALTASASGTWKTSVTRESIFLDNHAKQILSIDSPENHFTIDYLAPLFVPADADKLRRLTTLLHTTADVDMELQLLPVRRKSRYVFVKGRAIKEMHSEHYFAGILTDITERKKSLSIEEERRKVQQLLIQKAAIEAQEAEREKISSILHDSVCQILYGIRYSLNVLKQQAPLPTELSEMNNLLQQAISELRSLSTDITPTILKDFGIGAGIQDLVRRLGNIDYHVTAAVDLSADRLSKDMQRYIFRIVQELINNSIKHSGVNRATITIEIEDNDVNICVKDEGKGFGDDLEVAIKNGSGIRGIANRVALMQGKFDIAADQGAIFRISLPLNTKDTLLYE